MTWQGKDQLLILHLMTAPFISDLHRTQIKWRHPCILGWYTTWYHNRKSSWQGNYFRITGPLWRDTTAHRWILLTGQVMQSFDIFSVVDLNQMVKNPYWIAGGSGRHNICVHSFTATFSHRPCTHTNILTKILPTWVVDLGFVSQILMSPLTDRQGNEGGLWNDTHSDSVS